MATHDHYLVGEDADVEEWGITSVPNETLIQQAAYLIWTCHHMDQYVWEFRFERMKEKKWKIR